MKYLITGGAGFIGSHLTDSLLAAGHKVVILDDLSTGRHDNLRAHVEDTRMEFVLGSILNEDLVDDVVRRVDAVYHLAAAVGVDLIVQRPLKAWPPIFAEAKLFWKSATNMGVKFWSVPPVRFMARTLPMPSMKKTTEFWDLPENSLVLQRGESN